MKKLVSLFLALSIALFSFAQAEDVKTLRETAMKFTIAGDYNNAIIVLNRALLANRDNLDLQKDLVQNFYLKQDYEKALDGVKAIVNRADADVATFQIAGNVYKALELTKDCEKMYKTALKKYPASGPLYSEYGELLFAMNDFSAINQWEKGISVDPNCAGNYYNAARFYYFSKDKVWTLVYGETFVNMESLSERATAMKELLLLSYKEKFFSNADLLVGEEKNKNGFAKAFLTSMQKQSSLATKGITIETLTAIRIRFILDWFANNSSKYPFRLFEFQQQLIREGMFDAYNQWLFGSVENLAAYDSWTKTHSEEYSKFNNFQKNRIFKLPFGQYYQSK